MVEFIYLVWETIKQTPLDDSNNDIKW
jgi:hypothetical protein